MHNVNRIRALLASAIAMLCFAAQAITLGQTDDFQDGTLMNWDGAQPANIDTDGPNGQGDRFLQVTSIGGSGQNSRLAARNLTQWQGNYAVAGVKAVEVDLRNQGDIQLHMRIVVFGSNGSRWTSITPAILEPGSGWQLVTFFLTANNMVRVAGFGTYDEAMNSCAQLMFRHNVEPSSGGDPIASQLGIDNPTALAGPTVLPSSFTVTRGVLQSGALGDLFFSDDQRVVVQQRPPFSVVDPSAQVVVEATSPIGAPSALRFRLEASSSFVPSSNGLQRLELFNFAQNRWDVMDERTPTTSDSLVEVRITSNPARYVQSGSRLMRARVGVIDRESLAPNWLLRLDQTTWTPEP